MGRNNISVVGKELNIFSNKSEMLVKFSAFKLDKKHLKSEVDFIKARKNHLVFCVPKIFDFCDLACPTPDKGCLGCY